MGTPLSFGLVANTLQEHRWFFNCKSTSEVRHTTHLYARSLLKKLLPKEDVVSLKSDLKKLLKKSKIDAYKLGIIPTLWEDMFDNINEF